jgi:hypothetical protein
MPDSFYNGTKYFYKSRRRNRVVSSNVLFKIKLNQFQQLEEELNHLKLETLRQEIQKGIDQADRGELLDGEEVMARLLARPDE